MLLFLVQPMMAKALLPRFGGSAGVWVACMLFFQVVLLLVYWYSYVITRHLSLRAQGWVHAALLLLSLSALRCERGCHQAQGSRRWRFWRCWRFRWGCRIFCYRPRARCCNPGIPSRRD